MKFERERAAPRLGDGSTWVEISPVSEKKLRRGLRYLQGISASRIAILTDDDGSYVQVGGSGMCCCLEWRDEVRQRHFRAFQQTPVVPWPGISHLHISSGSLALQQEEYFRIQQVEEAFLAFFHHQRFPDYIQWRDITDEVAAAANRVPATDTLSASLEFKALAQSRAASPDVDAPQRIKPEPTRTVRNRISKQLTQMLADWTFRRRHPYLITAPWGEAEAQIWCHVRKCKSSGRVLISIDVEISFEDIQTILGRGNTVGTSIDKLRGTNCKTEWDTAQPETLPAIFDQIKTYAFPFFETHSTLDRVFAKLQSADRKNIGLIATIMTVKGQKQAALDLLDQEIASVAKSHPDPYATLSERHMLQNYRKKISDFSGA